MHPSSWHVNNRELVAEDRVTLNSSSLSDTVFFLCHKRMATCSSQFYWNKARTGLAYRRTSLYCRKFAFYRNSYFCPWNTFPRANVVGCPCSYPVMAVVEVTDVAHLLPLHAFVGWSVRRTANLPSHATNTSARLDGFLQLCSRLNVVSGIHMYCHVRLNRSCLEIARTFSCLWLRKINLGDMKATTFGNLRDCNQHLLELRRQPIPSSRLWYG